MDSLWAFSSPFRSLITMFISLRCHGSSTKEVSTDTLEDFSSTVTTGSVGVQSIGSKKYGLQKAKEMREVEQSIEPSTTNGKVDLKTS